MTLRYLWAGAMAVLFLAAGSGCGDRLHPIDGEITVDGLVPAKGTWILFSPVGSTRPATAKTDEQGRFRLTTTTTGDGVMRGEYKVVVVNSVDDVPLPQTMIEREDDPAYKAYLKAVEDFKRRRPKQGLVPLSYSTPARTPLSWKVPDDGVHLTIRIDSAAAK
jgi:hypothetical protein